MERTTVEKEWHCDVCLKAFNESAIHIRGRNFCSWDCAYTAKGQSMIQDAEFIVPIA